MSSGVSVKLHLRDGRTDGRTKRRVFCRGSTSRVDVDTAWRRRSWWTLLQCVCVSPSVRPFVRLLDGVWHSSLLVTECLDWYREAVDGTGTSTAIWSAAGRHAEGGRLQLCRHLSRDNVS